MKKLPISCMVVGLNEESLLTQCLQSVDFCDEILYADLGSTDNSINIAELAGANVYQKQKLPSGEYTQAELVHLTKHEWVIFIDPDEMVDESLKDQIISEFESIQANPQIGCVTVPWHFYYNKYKLKGTIWGGNNQKYFLVNKNRFDFLPITHYGRKIKNSFHNHVIELNSSGTNILHHYWMTSTKVFLKKHLRYLKNEGMDQYNAGIRMSRKEALLTPLKEFKKSFLHAKGFEDGIIGFFLSLFWSYYKTSIAISILKIQYNRKHA